MFAILAKVLAPEPKRAEKTEKGEIIKQLLALSELETRAAGKTASASATRIAAQPPAKPSKPNAGGKPVTPANPAPGKKPELAKHASTYHC